tara:strand:+ start:974 stop:2740 length:1767 start_codon:yes stop_codon:yes gene_type:complete
MSQFWEATSKIPVEQTTVRLASTNGLTYSAGQEIRLTIPQDITYFNPSGTYLEGKVRIKAPTYSDGTAAGDIKPCRLQLDAQTGVSSLIRNITLRSGNGVLLEEIDHYNSWVALKTDYSTNESLKGRRALTDGSTDYKIDSRGTQGTTKSIQNDISTNPYFKPATAASVSGSASFNATDFVEATFAIPLHTGILSNTKLFPNGLVGQNGLQITCLLEQNNVAFRQLEGNSLYRKTRLNPIFHGRNDAGASMASASAGTYTTIFLNEQNSQNVASTKCAFVVGQRIGFFNASTGLEATYSDPGGPEIAAISYDANDYLVLNLKSAINNTVNIDKTLGDWFIYDRSTLTASTYNPTYEISDVNIVIQKVTPPAQYESEMLSKMKSGGTINYDFDTVSTYLYSQLATDRVANIRLPIENERCKSILCLACDATPYTTQEVINASKGYKIEVEEKANVNWFLRSDRPNLVGIVDEATSYQWYYDNRLQPARECSLTKLATKKSISAVHLIQLDDALSAAGITAHSLKSFRDNFVVGRALGLNNMTYDARNKDFNLQINYQGTTAPTKSKLWKSYVVSIRRLEISSTGVRVII